MSWVQDIFIGETLQEQKPHEVGEFAFLKIGSTSFLKSIPTIKCR